MESLRSFSCSELDSFAVSDFLGQAQFSGGQDDRFSHSGVNDSLVCSFNNPLETNFSSPVFQHCSHSPTPTDTVSLHNLPACFFSGFNQIPLNNSDMFMGIANTFVGADQEINGCVNHDPLALAKDMTLKRKFDSSENASKRIRVSRDLQVGSDGQSSCSYSSEDENGAGGLETKPSMAMNSNGKARAARGGATDPQSLYARRRRERINERLRILQNLVPNGTKVDISTMLEEAVHYVKFLQLQIKLLSSDDLWMYAPLAYNGIDVSLHHKIFSQLLA